MTLSDDKKALVRAHRSDSSLLRKAQIEDRLWELLEPEKRKPFRTKPHYLKHMLGGSIHQYTARGYLLRAKGNSELWRRVEHEALLVTTATRLHRDARALAKLRKISLTDALCAVLKEYDALPMRGDVRVRTPSNLSPTRQRAVNRERNSAKRLRKNGDTFWMQLRDMIREYATAQLPDGEPIEIEPVWRALETDLKVIIGDFQSRLSRLRREQREGVQPVKRARLRNACQTLHLDPPTKTKPLDLAKARKQKRVLARAYHPDAHGGDDSMRAQYDAVLEAYRIIEQWTEEQTTEANQ